MSALLRWSWVGAALVGCAGADKGADGGPALGGGDAGAEDGVADGGGAGSGDGAGPDGGGAGGDGAGADGGDPPRDIGCAEVDLGSGLGELSLGTLAGAADRHGYCGAPLGADGEDRLFYWVAPEAGDFTFRTEGSDFDTMLTLYRGACVRIEACNDDYDGAASAVDARLEAGEVVVLALDAYTLGEASAYVISVRRGALPEEPGFDTGDTGGGRDSGDTAPAAAGAARGPAAPPGGGWFGPMFRWIERGVRALFG